jgi:hypothetical protein
VKDNSSTSTVRLFVQSLLFSSAQKLYASRSFTCFIGKNAHYVLQGYLRRDQLSVVLGLRIQRRRTFRHLFCLQNMPAASESVFSTSTIADFGKRNPHSTFFTATNKDFRLTFFLRGGGRHA